ncbi:MAG: ATP-binding protein [Tepidimonas sp.]|uniref:ATP-binding protein n=1 Tax=Tepidimonas sp. TaxID=2002775 RepID=UPI00298F1539|nr:ATP-binding protein [Tepidimonas sp.]MDW8337030.1 ATP-binding protein [Tepidimonas sp.]
MPEQLLRRNLAIVSLQYELALSIGQDLHLEPMLRHFVPTALKLLGARAGAVWEGQGEAVLVYPARSRAYLPPAHAWPPPALGQALPAHDGGVWQRAELPGFGWIAWLRSQPVDDDIERALLPIWQRLALACRACRQHEQTEELRARAEAANVARGQFLANMSHEIRTPLSGVVGLLELALDQAGEPGLRSTLETALGAARHLIDIVNDILDLSKIEAGRLELRDEPFDPRALLRDIEGAMRASAQLKGLALTVQADPALPARLRADATRLRQVLFNLVGNAIKFTDRGGVTLTVRAVPQTDGRWHTEWAVQDTGIGIPPAQLARIFDPFVQGEGAANRRYGGTGLGLAISRELVQRMGGELTVRSTPGQGSTFTVTLPLAAVADPPAAEPAQAEAAATPMQPHADEARVPLRILVAEDHPVNRRVIDALLRRAGHDVTFADDGRMALALAQQEAFDLVLMDMQMPVMDGLQATEALRAWEAATGRARLPVVALTANAFGEDRQRCLAAGMDDFLAKPIERAALQRVLAEAQRIKRRRVNASATQNPTSA